jgi:gliding motility-associated-like protein
MNLPVRSAFLKFGLFLLFFILSVVTGFSQTVVPNGCRHESLSQQQIDIPFTPGLAGVPNTADWIVRVAGTIVPVSAAIRIGNTVRVTFNASGVPGHLPGQVFIKPGESVTVAFPSNTSGTFNGATFAAQQTSQNNYDPDCSDFGIGANGGIFFPAPVSADICSPVIMNFTQFQWPLSLRTRNSSLFSGGNIINRIDWGDTSPPTDEIAYLSDINGVPSATTFLTSAPGLAGPAVIVTTRPNHPYPPTLPLTGGDCTWDATITPVLNIGAFTTCGGSPAQSISFVTYDTDNKNTGMMNMPPFVPNSDKVCRGNNVNMLFDDQTQLNCRSAVTVKPNELTRNIRIVYGSTDDVVDGNIPDIRVQLPAILGGATVPLTNSVTGALLFPGGYFPTSVGPADANGVINLGAIVTAPSATTYMGTITTVSATNQVVDQKFFVRLEYWDVCNPYDGVSTANAESIESFVVIIAKPQPLGGTGTAVCFNGSATNFVATSSLGGLRTAVNWYKDRGSVGTITKMSNPTVPVGNSLTFPTTSYTGVNGAIGGNFSTNNVNGRYHSVWATQVAGLTNGCESDPVELVIIQQPDLTNDIPVILSGDDPVCNNNNIPQHDYTASLPPTNKNINASTSSNLALINFPTENLWTQGFGAGVTLTPLSGIGNLTTVTYAISPEPSPSVTNNIRVRLRYQSGNYTVTPQVAYTPFPVAPYNIAIQSCQNGNVNKSVQVDGVSNAGTISPATQTICEGAGLTTSISVPLASLRGIIVGWKKSVDGSPFGADFSLGSKNPLTTPDLTIPVVTGSQTIYRFRAVVQNGSCAPIDGPIATVIVNQRPATAVLAGGATICQGGSTNLTVTITGGTGPYSVVYRDNGVNQPAVNLYASGTNIPVSPLTPPAVHTYTLASVTDAPGCTSILNSGSAVVTVSNPANAFIDGDFPICPNTAANFNVVITGGVSPYTLRYTDGSTTTTLLGYISGTLISTGLLITSKSYTIIDVRDANNCLSLLNFGSADVTVGTPPSAATFGGGGVVCQNGGLNLNLNISNGVPPYTVTIPGINMAVLFPLGYTSGANIAVPTGVVGPFSYSATLITDACGNALLAAVSGNPQLVTVGAVPTAAALTVVPTICSKSTTNIDVETVSAVSVPSTYTWTATYDPGLTGGAASGGPATNIIAGPLINAGTNVVRFAEFTITPTANSSNCPGATFKIRQPVYPEPVATLKTTAAVCSNTGFSFDPQIISINGAGGNSVPSTFVWSATYPPGLTLITSGTGIGNISETIQNLSSGTVNAIYNVSPLSNVGSCAGNDFTILVPINPQPVATDKVTAAVCSSIPFSFNPQTVGINGVGGNSVASSFTWTALYDPGLTGGAVSGIGNITGTLVNTSAGVLNAVYTITPKSTVGNCIGSTFDITVPINAEANVTLPLPIDFRVCEVGPTSTGSATFSIVTTGPGLSIQWQEKVGALPFANIANGGVYGGATSSTLAITGATVSMNNNKYRAVLTTTGGCTVISNIVTLNVDALPVVNNPTISQCSDTPGGNSKIGVDLTDPSITSLVHSVAGHTFSWFTDPGATTTPIFPGALPGQDQNYTIIDPGAPLHLPLYVRVTETATLCESIATVTFIVNPQPFPNTIAGPGATCIGNSFAYTVAVRPGSTYSWTIPIQFTILAGAGGAISGGGAGPFTTQSFVTLDLTTVTPGAVISVVERNNGCDGAPNTKNIVVAATPGVINIQSFPIAGVTNFCKENTAVFEVPTIQFNPASTYIWSIENPIAVGTDAVFVGSFAGTGLQQVIVKMGTKNSAIIKVQESNSGCPGTAIPLAINILDAPVMTPSAAAICSGDMVSSQIDFSTLVSQASTFTWTVKNITGGVTGAFVNDTGTSLDGLINIPLFNVSGSNGTITYEIVPTATAAPNCIGSPLNYIITVKPEPVVSVIADQSICPLTLVNGAISFPFGSNVAGATFNWTNSNPAIGLAPLSGTGNIGFTAADNLTGSDIVSTIVVSATANSCTSAGPNLKSFTITLKPRPVVDPITDVSVCPGDPISIPGFTANTSGGESYNWTNNNSLIGLPLSGIGNIAAYFAPANNTGSDLVGNISVKGTLNSCQGPAQTFKITIKPQPVVASITDKSFCSGEPISISLGSNVTGALINWTNTNTLIGLAAFGSGDISGTAGINNTGADIVSTIAVTALSNGCISTGANSKTFTITIKPSPIVDPITDIVVCSGGVVPTTVFGSNVSAGGVTFNWSNDTPIINLAPTGSGNISSFTAAPNTTGVPIIATITVSGSKNLCSGSNQTFTITVNPEPVVAVVTSQQFCPGDPINISLSSNVAGASISWNNTNPLIGLGNSGSGNISFTAPANNTGANITGNITVTATNLTCTSTGANSKTFSITIKPTPIVTAITDIVVCSGDPVPAINFSANTGGSEAFNWTNDNLGIGLALSGTTSIPGYFAPINVSGLPIVANLSVTATKNLCSGPAQNFKITINPEPVVTAVTNQSFCAGEPISIPLFSNVAGASITWTNTNMLIGLALSGGGDITSIAPANNTGSDIIGTITVVASKNTCTSTGVNAKTFTITIKPTPIVNPITNIIVCSGQPVSAITFGSNVGLVGVSFSWTNDNALVGLGISGTGNIGAFTAGTNTTGLPIVATVSVTGTKNLCLGPVRTFTITVLSEPVGVPTSKPVCSDEAVAVNLNTLISGGVAASSYDISIVSNGLVASAGSPGSGGVALLATEIQDDRWTNTTGAPVNVVYTITPRSGTVPSCSGASFDLTIVVNPEPVVNVVTNKFFCPADPVNIPLSSNVPTASISWTNSNPLIGISFNGVNDIIYTAPANNTGADITGTITVTATKSGCASTGANSKSFNITIRATPIINVIADKFACSGQPIAGINFSANTLTGEVFNWTNDNVAIGLPISGSGNIASYTAPANTTGSSIVANITVTATKNLCSGPPVTFKITLDAEPLGTSDTKAARCSDEVFTIDPQLNVSNITASSFTWTATYDGSPIPSGSGIISNVSFNNESNSVKNVVYTIKPSAGTCVGADFTITVPINPEPVMLPALANPTPVCSTNASSINPINVVLATKLTSIAADTYIVSINPLKNPDLGVGLLGLSGAPSVGSFSGALFADAIKSDKYSNVTAATLIVVYTVQPKTGTCLGDPFDVKVKINPEPVLSNPGFPDVCSTNTNTTNPANIVLGTNGISVNASSYDLLLRQYSTTGPGGPFSSALPTGFSLAGGNATVPTFGGNQNIIKSERYTNTSNNYVTVRYTIQSTSAGTPGCKSDLLNYDIVVNPQPAFTATPPNLCSGVVSGIALTTTSSVGISQYKLKQVNVPAPLIAGSGNAPLGLKPIGNFSFLSGDTFINTDPNPLGITVTYTLSAISGDGCEGPDQTLNFTVRPAPVVDDRTYLVCSGDASGIVLATETLPLSVAAASYSITNISIDPGLTTNPANASTTPLLFPTTNINYLIADRFVNTDVVPRSVKYTIVANTSSVPTPACSGPSRDIILTIEPTITMVDPGPQTICSNSPNSKTATNFILNSNVSPSSGPITFDYVAKAIPAGSVIGFFPSRGNVPNMEPIRDSLVNVTNSVAIVRYTITPKANGSGARSGAGCPGGSIDVDVTVEPKPRLSITPSTQVVCSDVATTMKLQTTTVPGAGTIQFVKVSETPSVLPPLLIRTSPLKTTYVNGEEIGDVWSNKTTSIQTVTYKFRSQIVAGLGCVSDDVFVVLTINPVPTITASPDRATICSSDPISIDLQPDPSPDLANTFTTFRVFPAAPSVIKGAAPGAGNLIFQTLFYNSATPTIANSDGPVVVNYEVTPKANGCIGSKIDVPITVNPKPKILAIPSTIKVCNGGTLNIPLASNVIGANYTWEVENPSGLSGIIEQKIVPGIFSSISQTLINTTGTQATLTYTIKAWGPNVNPNECEGDQKTVIVTVAPEISASFQNPPASICKGTSEFLIIQINGQAPFNFIYSQDDGVTKTNIAVNKAGNFKVVEVKPNVTTTYKIESVTDAFNCPVTITGQSVTITVFLPAAANFTIGNIPPYNSGSSTVIFANSSTPTPIDFTIYRYDWTFGGDGDANPSTLTQNVLGGIPITYSFPGTKEIVLKATNIDAESLGLNCNSEIHKIITILLPPLSAFFEVDPKEACFPAAIKLNQNTLVGTGILHKWTVLNKANGVKFESDVPNPVEFKIGAPGEYVISYRTSVPATGQTAVWPKAGDPPIVVKIYDLPIASFDLRPDVVFVPDTEMSTFNFTTGANGYNWDFGDGGTSEESDPKYTYQVEGRYDVQLIAKFDHGNGVICRDTLTQKIIAKQGGQAKIPNAFTPNVNGPSPDGRGANGTFNDVFLPLVKGIPNDSDAYNLQIYDRWGNLIFESTSSTRGWDGYNKDGKLMPAGVYVYKLTLRFSDSQRTTQVGDVTMIH